MHKIAESAIEEFAIELFEKLGYQYIYAPSIAPDSETPERERFEDVLLLERLRAAVARINPSIPAEVREEAIKQIQRLNSPELIANNEAFHRMLTEGIKVTYQHKGNERGDLVWLVDFARPENNEFVVANQFTVIGQHSHQGHQNKRPDVVLFVNGLPLVVIELKNAADENATVKAAYQQLQTYKEVIPGLFTYNGQDQPPGDRKGGVVWHTQGSGKSLSMVFYTGKIVLALDNPTIVMVITDRNDLDDQLFDTFAAYASCCGRSRCRWRPRAPEGLLKVASGGVVFTTIQKFQPEEGNVYEELTARRNIVVIADEAHRTQYGFKAKTWT
jgi:type I site-specific restriction-modification system R (restriction) subunit